MKFTATMFGIPIGCFLVSVAILQLDKHSSFGLALGAFSLFAIWIAIPVVFFYWIFRVFRKATDDHQRYR